MVNIQYGFNESEVLSPLVDGFEPINGMFLDFISVNDRTYLVSKLNNELQSIDVREVVQDVYPSGKIKLYANSFKNCDACRLEEILNAKYIKMELAFGEVVKVLRTNGLCVQDSCYQVPEEGSIIVSIDQSLFESTRVALRNIFSSFAQLMQKVNSLEADLECAKALKLVK